MKTTCSKITIEFMLNLKVEYITYENISVWEAMKKLKKIYGEVYIYGIETKY